MSTAVLEPPPQAPPPPTQPPAGGRRSVGELLSEEPSAWPRVTKDEYHRMIERGLLEFGGRWELLDGYIVRMPAHSPEHADAIDRIVERLFELFRKDYQVSCQLPVTLEGAWEPEPDVVLRSRRDRRDGGHPTAEEVVLAVEVGRTSGRTDRDVKLPKYAACGIPEVWLVDVHGKAVHVFREPTGETYASQQTFTGDAAFGVAAKPGPTLTAAEVFGP